MVLAFSACMVAVACVRTTSAVSSSSELELEDAFSSHVVGLGASLSTRIVFSFCEGDARGGFGLSVSCSAAPERTVCCLLITWLPAYSRVVVRGPMSGAFAPWKTMQRLLLSTTAQYSNETF